MADQTLPENVRRFITHHVTSVEQLEVLILLQDNPSRWWSARDVADDLRTSPSSAARRLEELGATGLLDIRLGPDQVHYRYHPANADVAATAAAVRNAYGERRVSVITFIYSRPPDPVRDFAESFRIAKRDDDA